MKWWPAAGALLFLTGCSANDEPAVRILDIAQGCNVTVQTCQAGGEPLGISLKLVPDVKPLKLFPVEVTVTGGEAEQVLVDFHMISMDMGLNRYRLKGQKSRWSGNALLPVCSVGRSDWVAEVTVIRGGERYAARFPFKTGD